MEEVKHELKNDFSQGSVVKNILTLAVPMTLAQLINVLYNIVDRIYIGRIPEHATLSMTGLGLCLPIISMVTAFSNLFGMGGAPLCSIERGRGNEEEAEKIMGNSFVLMVIFGIGLTILGLAVKRPMLYLFGASDQTFPYAGKYISIYLLGNVFVMIGLGMNSFINSQGFGRIGMMTVLLGAITNIILDPVFIFVFHMGIQGAALATIISQGLSAAWIVHFLIGEKTILKLKRSCMKRIFNPEGNLVADGIPAMRIYYFGFFLMSLQFAGQSVFVALGKAKQAVFFSIFRKVIIVVPLTWLLPRLWGLGTAGVFMAEPISNLIGGLACFITMLVTVLPELQEKPSHIN